MILIGGDSVNKAHDVEFKIHGDDMQFVEIELDGGESILAEAGAMMYMDHNIRMETIFGDGSGQAGGLMGKLFGAGKRALTGEGIFMTVFTNIANEKAHVAFASPYPGKIVSGELMDFGGSIICQKDAFLCAAKGVSIDIHLQKKIGTGFFGGEGFIMQKLQGDGLVFLHAGGTIIKKDLLPGDTLKVDTGCLVAMTSTVDYDIQFVGDIKSGLFGGEGLFLATLRGPGSVWLQSLPFSRMADRILANYRGTKGETKGMNSPLDELSGLGDLFGRD